MTDYVEATYAKIAKAYSDEFFDDMTDLPLLDMLTGQLRAGATVLDVGCGPGQYCKYLYDKGFMVEGVDITDEMLRIAADKVPQVAFKKMDMRHLLFDDHCFDAVLAAYSIIHIPSNELDLVFSEIQRILKPNGYALFITQEGPADQILDEPLAKGEKIFMNFFTKDRIAGFVSRNNLTLLKQATIKQVSEDVLSSVSIGTLVVRS